MKLLLDQDTSAGAAEILRAEGRVVDSVGAELMRGSAVTVTPSSIRLHALPLTAE